MMRGETCGGPLSINNNLGLGIKKLNLTKSMPSFLILSFFTFIFGLLIPDEIDDAEYSVWARGRQDLGKLSISSTVKNTRVDLSRMRRE